VVSTGVTHFDQASATVLALSCAAAALLAWPVRGPVLARPRGPLVRGSRSSPGDRDGVWKPSKVRSGGPGIPSARATLPIAAAAVLVVGAAAGLAVGMAAGITVLTAGRLARSMLTGVRHRRELVELSTGLRLLGRELRNGAAPQAACAAAAAAAMGSASTVLLRVAAETIRTNPAGRIGPQPTGRHGPAAEVDLRLRQGLVLADSYGVPWADVVTAVAVDIEERARAEAARATEAVGPRLSGYVLAALPALGVLLGIGMGADPMAVLFGSAPGNLLLLTGTVLTCAGLVWSARIAAG